MLANATEIRHPAQELRRDKRFQVSQAAIITQPGHTEIACEIRDFCLGGLFLKFTNPEAAIASLAKRADAEVEIVFTPASLNAAQTFRVPAQLTRLSPLGVGVAFARQPVDALRALQKLRMAGHRQKLAALPASHAHPQLREASTALLSETLLQVHDQMIRMLGDKLSTAAMHASGIAEHSGLLGAVHEREFGGRRRHRVDGSPLTILHPGVDRRGLRVLGVKSRSVRGIRDQDGGLVGARVHPPTVARPPDAPAARGSRYRRPRPGARKTGGGRRKGDPGVNRRYIIGAIVAAVVVVGVLIGISFAGGGDDSVSSIENVDQVTSEFAGIPSDGSTIGNADATVEIVEYGDTSCPVCKDASETSIPQVVDEFVKTGQAKMTFRPIAFISRSSERGALGSEAAGMQNVMWPFVTLIYANQGPEQEDWLSDALLKQLFEHLREPRFVYAHRWQVGDLLIWDNAATQHRATCDYALPQRRLMHRTATAGEDACGIALA